MDAPQWMWLIMSLGLLGGPLTKFVAEPHDRERVDARAGPAAPLPPVAAEV